ncbi:type II toxin-antitoxin system VapC family toxin [Kutzneria buriramensis]|uniref:Ribonuclease VapC n=1 Tax=Kutzneria buriramensis TaxID=1045776 RepID=A0A3E0HAH7_9PSEU|nr:type II toxin-antitoxin system VapC family toxin [Kutzneria buriramensis]REH41039.1 putative nucleic acid-binding protein [Kutzneria buriramensis]
MTDIVLDSSAFVYATTVFTEEARELRKRIAASTCHVPHLADAEVGSVLRRQELAGDLSADDCLTALHSLKYLVDNRYPAVRPLSDAAWQLRGAITYYDALHVALAASLGAPLVTMDARLSRAPGLTCEVELVGQP